MTSSISDSTHTAAWRSSHAAIRFGSKPQAVLVTGGTGFIGRALIKRLLEDGHRPTVWARNADAAASTFDNEITCVARLEDISSDIDVVINLAGARIVGPRWSAARRHTLMQSRVGLTDELVEWIGKRTRKPWLMISGSAVGYYGPQRQGDDAALAEDAPPKPDFGSQLCRAWEQSAQRATAFGVHVACERFGVVLGHGGGSLQQLLLPIRLGLGSKLGTGRQWMSWIHLHDLLRAMAHVWTVTEAKTDAGREVATSQAAFTTWNFTAPNALKQEDFTRTAAQVLHRPFWFPRIPATPVRLLLGEQSDLLLEGQRVVPRRLIDSGFHFEFPDARTALADLT